MALRLKSDCGEIEVFFHHKILSVAEIWELAAVVVDGPRRCSTVIMKIGGIEQNQGITICHPNDNFNKSLGRKKALTEVLFGFNRELRKAVWDKYRSEIGFA